MQQPSLPSLNTSNLINSLNMATFVINNKHEIILWNSAIEELTNIPAQDIIGTNQHWKTLYTTKRPCLADMILTNNCTSNTNSSNSNNSKQCLCAENWFHTPQGSKYLISKSSPLIDDNGQTIGAIQTFQDISELKNKEEKLQKISAAVASSASMIMITDINGNIEYTNQKFTEITGYSKQEILGQNPRLLQSGQITKETYTNMWKNLTSNKGWQGTLHNKKKNGDCYLSHTSIASVKNTHGDITNYICIQDDRTNTDEAAEKRNYQATHDILTGLVNRHEFEHLTKQLLIATKYHKHQHAICLINIDQFKIINDTYGHTVGDEILRQISSLLKHKLRKRDTIARLGGDEFGVLMGYCPLDKACQIATSLRETINTFSFKWKKYNFQLSVSIGLTGINADTSSIDELLQQLDAACYMAKDRGRNRVHVYQEQDTKLTQRHNEMQWATRIHTALKENRFCLYAQPIESLKNDSDSHYELLIRMLSNKKEIINPGEFLPAAERYNLIKQIDSWVIKNAFSLLSMNDTFLKNTTSISINLSGPSLTDRSILDFIIKQLQETKIDGRKICFEITETAAIYSLSYAVKFISTLKGFGCKFALDDFGSGLSSFGYLKILPVDYLKIDGMFIKDIASDPIDRAMVKSLNEIAQTMGIQTIAEFVETDEIKTILKDIGINYAQGYGIAKPCLFTDIIAKQTKELL